MGRVSVGSSFHVVMLVSTVGGAVLPSGEDQSGSGRHHVVALFARRFPGPQQYGVKSQQLLHLLRI